MSCPCPECNNDWGGRCLYKRIAELERQLDAAVRESQPRDYCETDDVAKHLRQEEVMPSDHVHPETVGAVTPPGVEQGSGHKTHHLKTWPEFFAKLLTAEKTFEYRDNDRDFGVGDTLVLEEWNPATKQYSGRTITARVSYLLSVSNGYVVMALADARTGERQRQAEDSRLREGDKHE